MAVNEEVPISIKQEEIPEDISFPDIKLEPNEVSCVCVYVCYWTHFTSVWKCQFFCDISISGQFKQLHSWE